MTAFESYKMYVALKLHFTTDSYDYFKFNGKTRVTETNFEKRKDRYFFKKLTNRKKDDEILPYFVSNTIIFFLDFQTLFKYPSFFFLNFHTS